MTPTTLLECLRGALHDVDPDATEDETARHICYCLIVAEFAVVDINGFKHATNRAAVKAANLLQGEGDRG